MVQDLLAEVLREHPAADLEQERQKMIVYHKKEIARHQKMIRKIRARKSNRPDVNNGIVDPPSNHQVVPNVTINPPSGDNIFTDDIARLFLQQQKRETNCCASPPRIKNNDDNTDNNRIYDRFFVNNAAIKNNNGHEFLSLHTDPRSISIKDQHTLTTFVDLINHIIPQAGRDWYNHNQYTRDVFLAFCDARDQHPELTAVQTKANAAIPLASQPSVQAQPCLTKPVLMPVSSSVSVFVTPPAHVSVTPPAPVSSPSQASDPARKTISTPVNKGKLLGSPETHTLAPTTDLPAYIGTPTYTWTYFPSTESVRFRKVVSSTISTVHPDTSPGNASHITNRARHSPRPSPKPSAKFKMDDSAIPSSVHAKDSAVPILVHVYSQHGAYSCLVPTLIYGAHSLTFNLPAVCITERHRDAIKLKLYHLHASLLVAHWLYDALLDLELCNSSAVNYLTEYGLKGEAFAAKAPQNNGKDKIASTKPGSKERILKIATARTAGQKFRITGGFVTNSYDIWKAKVLKERLNKIAVLKTTKARAAQFAKKKEAAEALVAKCGGEFARLGLQALKVVYEWKLGKKVGAGMKKEHVVAALVKAKDDAPVGAVEWSEERDGAELERLEKEEIKMKETELGKAMAEKLEKCVRTIKEVTPEMLDTNTGIPVEYTTNIPTVFFGQFIASDLLQLLPRQSVISLPALSPAPCKFHTPPFLRLLRSTMAQRTGQNYDNWSDWNYVEAIEFSFGKPVGAGKNNAAQNLLNAAYSQILTNINSILAVDNHGAETLKPDAISRIKFLVTAAIIENLPLSEVSPKCKKHIRMLLEHSTIWYLDKDTTRRPVHDYHTLAPAANAAKLNYHQYKYPTIQLEFSIQHWGFDKGWYPYEFAKVYDRNSEATASEKSKPLKPLPTLVSYIDRVANILKLSRRIISGENEFRFDLPDPYFEYVAFKQIYRMAFPPSYTWTWTYSPNSPPVQREDRSTVASLPVTPSTLPRSDHHSAPPWKPTSFVWTFNPQNEIATFRRVPTTSVPTSQPPMCHQLLPSAVLANDTDHPHAAPAYMRSLQSPCHNPISSRLNHPLVLRLSKRHQDALKVNLYHLYANILSMNWFYDTFD
eukprot:jgi/Psemu1/52163/gm1.52163_g